MRKAMVAGNWKMNGSSKEALSLVRGFVELQQAGDAGDSNKVGVVLCPSELYIPQVKSLLPEGSGIAVGAQNASDKLSGAHTGEVSVEMLLDVGCEYVILGHSERRALYAESDAVVAAKVRQAIESGITPILCVGESQQEREAGVTMGVVERQLAAIADLCGIEAFGKSVVAYEPVWAIGTGLTATPEQAQAVHAGIRSWVSSRDAVVGQGLQILYGGSVKASNAESLFACEDIDGGLIGGASLDAGEFAAICRAAG
ncbi:triose-phosphate isomerase [Gammaproteobacteria bacterium 45_16_T64]|nr:triose-phosphate isomerase [Gammaproteobacteria bacterium 45_16_T64]